MKIYLAGKIAKGDWRNQIVGYQWNGVGEWPLTKWGNHLVTGPYFIGCDHGCYHGDNSHGMGAADSGTGGHGASTGCSANPLSQEEVVDRCVRAISQSDVVFVWLDEKAVDAYGTIAEIGIAYAMGKLVWIASPFSFDRRDFWFPVTMAHKNGFTPGGDPLSALTKFLEPIDLKLLPYSEYLQTTHWKSQRAGALARARSKCQLCGGTERLEVHHNCYDRIGEEATFDLFVLCHECHTHFHQRLKKPKVSVAEVMPKQLNGRAVTTLPAKR